MRFDQLCDQITSQIIDAIDAGSTGVWRAPWHHNGQAELFAPTNLVTGNRYAGTNILQLAFAAIEAGWEQATFATYCQLQSVGAQVRRGEHGTRCVKWVTKTVDTDDADGPVGVLVPKVFTVFNVAQTDGYQPPEPVTFDTDPIENVEAFIAATGAYIDVGHNTAKYRPLIDRIQICGRLEAERRGIAGPSEIGRGKGIDGRHGWSFRSLAKSPAHQECG